jgi:hypothetical protein
MIDERPTVTGPERVIASYDGPEPTARAVRGSMRLRRL